MGHEFAGEVAALGSGVSGWDVGEPVVALPYMACGSCAACVAGDGIRCTTIRSLGLGDLPGAYAEYVRVHPESCLRIPDGIGFRAAALVEPLAVALHGVRMARVAAAAGALQERWLDVDALVTDVVTVEDAPQAFEALMRPITEGKVLIEF